MKELIFALSLISLAGLTSCTSAESGVVEISVTSSMRLAIPAKGTSCYATKSALAGGTVAVPDVDEAYFVIPKITFKVADAAKDTYVSAIKIYYTPPGGTEITCAFGGDQLAALKATWWSNANKYALIPAGATDADKMTDCSIQCGGISVDAKNFSASGTIKVYGYIQDPDNDDDTTGFTATTFFTYGSQY
ncbi:hypothetical protein ACLSU7_15880 [Bdellovibrio sp. HCB185ZH]|uniref:hypothetical protein n=1 Tax=Bdellovibrio sp. HCB185ZH TaxID=3394235 RepID=UPI0039A4CE83